MIVKTKTIVLLRGVRNGSKLQREIAPFDALSLLFIFDSHPIPLFYTLSPGDKETTAAKRFAISLLSPPTERELQNHPTGNPSLIAHHGESAAVNPTAHITDIPQVRIIIKGGVWRNTGTCSVLLAWRLSETEQGQRTRF